jgi:ADP-heptose:LPS heptosyltransferase
LQGKTVLLYSEQGLGDTIQFCRYAKLVSELGARVIMEVPGSLKQLMQELEGVDVLIGNGEKSVEFDYHCPFLSLPLAFKTTIETIPSLTPYLFANQKSVKVWSDQLGTKAKPRVGLVWSGNSLHKKDANRSLTLAELLPYLPTHIDYVCLQKELREIDKALLAQQPHIQWFGDALVDFSDTAALCELMDVIISVDTSVAHLAGSLGKTTWVLLPFSPDWRWLLDRLDSPWYPSAQLYRQEAIGNWQGPLEKVKTDLMALV